MNGEPYENAAIMFLDLNSGQAAGADIDAGGSFTIAEPMHTGTYKAYLAPRSLPPEENGQPIPVSADSAVPEKYWNENTTDIEVEVKEGENSTTIALEK
ncbi:hypothetical protein [Roseimaritima multifibrata]|uniref:hypothetical protein n=1 Tax=Roseimaritima multifibrata TaxID=1930274 RepID=UPI0011AA6B44|nr:hypothetical protein [Roseimaritima multifibrata]